MILHLSTLTIESWWIHCIMSCLSLPSILDVGIHPSIHPSIHPPYTLWATLAYRRSWFIRIRQISFYKLLAPCLKFVGSLRVLKKEKKKKAKTKGFIVLKICRKLKPDVWLFQKKIQKNWNWRFLIWFNLIYFKFSKNQDQSFFLKIK
jgi:hypothetical protein